MNIIEKLAHKTNYGQRRNHIKFIVLHYTGNDGDRAWNNANFFQNSPNLKASAHYFVDDENIYQSVPDDYTAYSVGVDYSGGKAKYHNICTNANSLNIELCDTEKNGKYDVTEQTINNAVELTRYLMQKYNIPIENVIRHYDVCWKNCPSYWVDDDKWQKEFKSKLFAEGWVKDDKGWWYRYADGSYPKSCWKTIKDKDYYFKADGYMASDEFIKSEDYDNNFKLYYVDSDGAWDGRTYRWMEDNKGWWLAKLGSTSYYKSQWAKVDGKWYYFKDSGYMAVGTLTIDGKIYSFRSDGSLVE